MQLVTETLPRRSRMAYGVLGVAAIVGVGELVVRLGVVSTPSLPRPSTVIAGSFRLLGDPVFLRDLGATATTWALGMAIAIVVGTGLGCVVGLSKRGERLMVIPIEMLRPLPSIAIGPLLVLVLTTGVLANALTVAFACTWPVLYNTAYGVKATDRVAIETGRSMRLGALASVRSIVLPSATPFIFAGIRIAASIAIIVTVSVEMLLGGGRGVGGFILLQSAGTGALDVVYAATLIAGLLGVAVSLGLEGLEARAFPWKRGLSQ